MAKKFLVSVITPVYKAQQFVREAVESAVFLDEVGEIILVEDGSPDNSLEECKALSKKFSKVKLFRHPNGINKGAGASRNLGIINSKNEFVSFLDADDIYLSNRFTFDKSLFQQDTSIDVVFNNGCGLDESWLYYNEEEIDQIRKTTKDDFLYNMLRGLILHTNCITIKKSLLEKTGYFNEKLKLHQDTDLWFRLAHFGDLRAGNLEEPVSATRNHQGRRISTRNRKSQSLLLNSVLSNFKKYKDVDSRFIKALMNKYAYNKGGNSISRGYYLFSILTTSSFFRKHYFK